MACCSCCSGKWAIVKFLRHCLSRKTEVIAKKAMLSRDTSCMKEWFMTCFPNGPLLKVVALGRVDLQWGLVVG